MTAAVVAAAALAECWSTDEEDFNAGSLGELIDMNSELRPGQTVWVGEPSYPESIELFDANDAIEQMGERACDIAGEYADGFPSVTVEQVKELGALIHSWIEKYARPTFYTVKNVRPYVLTKNDIPGDAQIGGAA